MSGGRNNTRSSVNSARKIAFIELYNYNLIKVVICGLTRAVRMYEGGAHASA